MDSIGNENRKGVQATFPKFVIYPLCAYAPQEGMMRTPELLRKLTERKVTKSAIARAIGVSNSRVTELYKGGRKLSLDEAATLAERFDLEREQIPKVPPLPPAVYEAIVLYVAAEIGADPSAQLVQELGQDVRAFAQYVRDPAVADRIDLANQFFEMMRLRRPDPAEEGRQENGTHLDA